jgi:hypothetical protein
MNLTSIYGATPDPQATAAPSSAATGQQQPAQRSAPGQAAPAWIGVVIVLFLLRLVYEFSD